jgi:hypothetical protein
MTAPALFSGHFFGFRDVSVDDLVSMRIHGVTTEFARRVKQREPGVTVDELVSMRIHGRD